MSECMETHSRTATVVAIMDCITKKECEECDESVVGLPYDKSMQGFTWVAMVLCRMISSTS
jgi:hypothetical protein